jgi:hypothetical protein
VSVVQDPYFEHQIYFLDRQYNTLEKVKLLEDSLARYGSEDEFFKAMRDLRNEIIDHVKEHPDYENLGLKHAIPQDKERKASERSIYKEHFCGKEMVSLDLVKANFQSFRLFGKDIVDNKDTYEEFVGQFTDDEYFTSSKKIRQVIFGNLNPKRQMTITKTMMHGLRWKLDWYSTDVLTVSADELVFEIQEITNLDGLRKFIDDNLKEKVRVQGFSIEKVPTKTSSVFVKKYPDGTFDLKCCPGNYTIEVLRHIYNEASHPYDKVFYNDGRLCEYRDSLF